MHSCRTFSPCGGSTSRVAWPSKISRLSQQDRLLGAEGKIFGSGAPGYSPRGRPRTRVCCVVVVVFPSRAARLSWQLDELHWRLKPSDLDRLSVLQSKLLTNASLLLKREGLLVYSTCSLEPEENEQVIQRFLFENPHFCLERSSNSELDSYYDQDGFVRLLPNKSNPDGFFGAVLRRV